MMFVVKEQNEAVAESVECETPTEPGLRAEATSFSNWQEAHTSQMIIFLQENSALFTGEERELKRSSLLGVSASERDGRRRK